MRFEVTTITRVLIFINFRFFILLKQIIQYDACAHCIWHYRTTIKRDI